MGLEFKIGKLEIDVNKYVRGAFIVENLGDGVAIYFSNCSGGGHEALVEFFKLDKSNIVGGGTGSLDEEYFIVGEGSGTYWGISPRAALKFAELIAEELRKQGLSVKGEKENTYEWMINSFWHGFEDLE
ncbi:MAG: hypothetical protein KAT77_00300 [Nanoarchaeota archaeon]|nr:hypothetical protein [Nanoarchaeota archaeon]